MIDYRIVGYAMSTQKKLEKTIKGLYKRMPTCLKKHNPAVFYFVAPIRTAVIESIKDGEIKRLHRGVRSVVVEHQPVKDVPLYIIGDYMQMITRDCPALRKIVEAHVEFIAGGGDVFRCITEDNLFFHLAWCLLDKKSLETYNPERLILCENLINRLGKEKCSCVLV